MRQISAYTKTAYGLGAFADGVKTTAFSIFLLFYYNQVLGLPAFWGGVAIGTATVIDAISDPLMGAVSDDFHHRWGRRHPFMYWSVLPLAVTFVLLFSPPAALSAVGLFVWLLSFTVLLRLAMTLYGVPHMALGAELSTDYHERTVIVGYRNFMSFVGAVFVIAVGWGVCFRSTPEFANGQLNVAAYPGFGLACGVAAALSVLCSALGTHARIPHLPRPQVHDRFSFTRLFADQRAALGNASFRALFMGVVLFFVTRGIEQGLGLYILTHFWQVMPSAIGLVQGIAMAGVLIGTVVWISFFGHVEKKPAFLLGISLFSVFSLMPPLAKMVDFWPAHASPFYVPLLAAVGFIAALGAAVSLITSGSMMADIADEHELQSGRRQEGVFFGGLIFAVKATSGLGQFIAGAALGFIDFPANAVPGTVPEDIVHRLAFLYGPGLSLIVIVAIVIMSRYRIDRARHGEITAALAARRLTAMPD